MTYSFNYLFIGQLVNRQALLEALDDQEATKAADPDVQVHPD